MTRNGCLAGKSIKISHTTFGKPRAYDVQSTQTLISNISVHEKARKEHILAINIQYPHPHCTLCPTTKVTHGRTYSPLAPTHT